jgi:glutathione peroxidase
MPNRALFVALLSSLSLVACDKAQSPAPASAATAPAAPTASASAPAPGATSLYAFSPRRLDGTTESLSTYKGKVVLVVNTASECGYTPQYEGLQKLHDELSPKGFTVLGFPSNDFGGQEPGTSAEIAKFCTMKFKVTFPMFEKVVTKGAGADPLYSFLATGVGAPEWNFHKYLVGKDGKVRKAYPSKVTPDDAGLRKAIEEALAGLFAMPLG